MSIRLNKLLAQRGLGARRKCDALIESGAVRVNGKVVREPGTQIEPERDRVEVAGRRIPSAPELRYFALNKPVGVITTLDDPEGRRALREFLPPGPRVYPVGRLDADTSGLLILTNDGELAHRLMHPRYGVEKHYRVRVDAIPTPAQLARLTRGVEFEPGVTSAPARATVLEASPEVTKIALTIHEGRYRQVRRMCEAVGLRVLSLHRAGYGPVRLGPIARGTWRELSEDEVARLRAASARPHRSGGPRLTEFDRAQRRIATARGVEVRRERAERPQREATDRRKGPDHARPRGFASDTRRERPARPSFRERGAERDPDFETMYDSKELERPSRPIGERRERSPRSRRDVERGPRAARGGGFERPRESERSPSPVRAGRFERPKREGDFERGSRPSSGGRFERPRREGESERGSRPRAGGFDRSPRGRDFERSSRPRRESGFERGSRPTGTRFSRPRREGDFERSPRPTRVGGFERPARERGPRPTGGRRFERPAREGDFARSPRPARGGRFERTGRPEREGLRPGTGRSGRPVRGRPAPNDRYLESRFGTPRASSSGRSPRATAGRGRPDRPARGPSRGRPRGESPQRGPSRGPSRPTRGPRRDRTR